MVDAPRQHKRKSPENVSKGRDAGKRPRLAALPSRKAVKRAKVAEQRQFQTDFGSSVVKDGKLDVAAFVQARENEIMAMEEGMMRQKKGLATRAFQTLPRHLRRRTMSHDVKRIPKRLRPRAVREMAVDKTVKKPRRVSPRTRLRMGTVKRLKGLARQAQLQAGGSGPGGNIGSEPKNAAGMENTVADRLAIPPKPKAKFKKRQLHKTWLPTHLYHSKRARMTKPLQPLWGFALPVTPNERCYRPTHRALSARGAVAWDTSYMSTIILQGPRDGIERVLREMKTGADGSDVWGKAGHHWRNGKRGWEGWIYDPSNGRPIAPVTIMWGLPEVDVEMTGSAVQEAYQVLIRLHPSAFAQIWGLCSHLAKAKHPVLNVFDHRFDIGSIEVSGPAATEVLTTVLKPFSSTALKDPTSPEAVWLQLKDLTNPATLPKYALLGFDIVDPRLLMPFKPQKPPSHDEAEKLHMKLLQLLANWPLDQSQWKPKLLDGEHRLDAWRKFQSQKNINSRKGEALPGKHIKVLPSDPQIPVILFNSRAAGQGECGKWTLMLPWSYVLPVWYALTNCPVSSGGQIRFGGQKELGQLRFEQGLPSFPADFPGTKPGDEEEMRRKLEREHDWKKRPKSQRLAYESVILSKGEKGEIGVGYACDWDILKLQAPLRHMSLKESRQALKTSSTGNQDVLSALCTVKLVLLQRGNPRDCARIYQLPTDDAVLREKWLDLMPQGLSKAHASSKLKVTPTVRREPQSAEERLQSRQDLALSLLTNLDMRRKSGNLIYPEAGDFDYPETPSRENLIGFVTTGNYSLTEGKAVGIGSIAIARILASKDLEHRNICIIRDSGQSIGRLARWELVE